MPDARYQQTLDRIEELRERFSGRLGLAARDLSTGEEFLVDHDHVFPTASAIKVAILYRLFQRVEGGELSLDDRVALIDAARVSGSGILRDLQAGLQPTVRDLATLMIVISDNVATNMTIDLVGGPEAVTVAMRELGLTATTLHRKIMFTPSEADPPLFGETSPFDLMRLAGMIGRGEAVSNKASRAMLEIMKRQRNHIQFPRFFGYNVFGPELGVEQRYWVANKTGSLPGVRADMGIVGLPGERLVAFCVMTEGSRDTGFTEENEGEITNGVAGRILLEHWWPEGFATGQIGIDSVHLQGY